MDKLNVIDTILKMYYEYGFPFKIDERLPISEHYSLNETFDISCDFLKQYDSNIYNMYLNLRNSAKGSFQFKTKEIDKDIQNEYNVFTGCKGLVVIFSFIDIRQYSS